MQRKHQLHHDCVLWNLSYQHSFSIQIFSIDIVLQWKEDFG